VCAEESTADSDETVIPNMIDGWIGTSFKSVSQSAVEESGSRSRFVLEFGRLSKSVAFDLVMGSGLNYTDIGGMLKIFQSWRIPSKESGFVMALGLGGGINYCGAGFTRSETTDDVTADVRRNFYEVAVSPFLRLHYDFGFGVALAGEAGYEVSPYRKFNGGSPISDSTPRKRMVFGVSLALNSNWLE